MTSSMERAKPTRKNDRPTKAKARSEESASPRAMSTVCILDVRAVGRAIAHLSSNDPVMRSLIAEHPRCTLGAREYRPFHTLVSSIISQQLSAKASETIQQRLACHCPIPFSAEPLSTLGEADFRAVGISGAKTRAIKELAERVRNGSLNFDSMRSLDDDHALEELKTIRGVGPWTAEMFLIFGLLRPDVLSLGDAGLHRAARRLYGKSKGREHSPLERVSRNWEPYRSVASWYLWRHLDAQ